MLAVCPSVGRDDRDREADRQCGQRPTRQRELAVDERDAADHTARAPDWGQPRMTLVAGLSTILIAPSLFLLEQLVGCGSVVEGKASGAPE